MLNLKKYSYIALICAGALVGVSSASYAVAAENKNIAIIDTQVLGDKATAWQKIREQTDKKAEEFKKESANKESYFKKKYDDLEKQKSVLSKEAYEKKYDELNKEVVEAQKKVQDHRNVLDKGHTEAAQKFEDALSAVVQEEAKKIGATLVLSKIQVLYSDQSLDITDSVIAALNKKLPSVAVKFE
jgi:outer membrane protein